MDNILKTLSNTLADTLAGILGRKREEEPDQKFVNSAWLTKDADGQWWFLGIYSNKFRDRHYDILSEAAHKNYIAWLKETGFQPTLTVFHQPMMAGGLWYNAFELWKDDIPFLQTLTDKVYEKYGIGKVVHVAYINGFVTVTAKIHADKADIAERLSRKSNLGMSHGFIPLDISFISKGKWDSIINEYRTFEMSVLPGTRAANLATRSQLMLKSNEVCMGKFSDEDRQFLVDIYGEDVVAQMEKSTEKQEELFERVMDYKNAIKGEDMGKPKKKEEEVVVETPTPEPTPEPTEAAAETEPAPVVQEEAKSVAAPELTVQVIATETAKAFTELHTVLVDMQKQLGEVVEANKALAAQNAELTKKVTDLSKSEDERIAGLFMPALDWRAGYSASKDDKNIVEEVEKKALAENAPTGEKANFDPDNPLNLGFWNLLQGA